MKQKRSKLFAMALALLMLACTLAVPAFAEEADAPAVDPDTSIGDVMVAVNDAAAVSATFEPNFNCTIGNPFYTIQSPNELFTVNRGWHFTSVDVHLRDDGPDNFTAEELAQAPISLDFTNYQEFGALLIYNFEYIKPAVDFFITFNENTEDHVMGMPAGIHIHTSDATRLQALPSAVPARQGYTFLGWATSADSATLCGSEILLEESAPNVTLYAVWEKKLPVKPREIEVKAMLAGKVLVEYNADTYKFYDLGAATYDISDPYFDADGIARCNILVNGETYISRFSTDMGKTYTCEEDFSSVPLVFVDGAWQLVSENVIAYFKVSLPNSSSSSSSATATPAPTAAVVVSPQTGDGAAFIWVAACMISLAGLAVMATKKAKNQL